MTVCNWKYGFCIVSNSNSNRLGIVYTNLDCFRHSWLVVLDIDYIDWEWELLINEWIYNITIYSTVTNVSSEAQLTINNKDFC